MTETGWGNAKESGGAAGGNSGDHFENTDDRKVKEETISASEGKDVALLCV